MTNILITGATGFIGSHLVQHLSEDKNNTIYGLARSFKNESVFNALKLLYSKNIILINGDLNNSTVIERCLHQYDINQIYHLAAQAIVKDAAECPVSTIQTNVIGTLNILESIRKYRCLKEKEIPTFIMSTDKAYGVSNKLPYIEDHSLNGQDIYSVSKVCEDVLSRSYAYNYDLPIVIGRPSNTYGLDFNWSRLIPSLAKSCLDKKEKDKKLILNEGSYCFVREYNYVEDIVLAIESLMKDIYHTKGQAFNISSGFKYTTEDVVNKFLKLSFCENKEIEFKKKENTFKEIPEQYLDSYKILYQIGWKPKYNLEDGLTKTITDYCNWFKSR